MSSGFRLSRSVTSLSTSVIRSVLVRERIARYLRPSATSCARTSPTSPSSRARRAPATVRGYEGDLAALFAYLEDRGQPAEMTVDAALVAAFIAAESKPDKRAGRERPARAPATIVRRVAAIAKAHQLQGLLDPTKDPLVKGAMAGARRRLGGAPSHAKDALELEAPEHMLHLVSERTQAGRRDRALLLDVRFVAEGMLVSIGASKTDQKGEGATLAIMKGRRPDVRREGAEGVA